MNPTKTCDVLRNLTTRDKESMIEEIAQLKKALLEKDAELRRRKVHTTNVESENRYHDLTYIAFFLNNHLGSRRPCHGIYFLKPF